MIISFPSFFKCLLFLLHVWRVCEFGFALLICEKMISYYYQLIDSRGDETKLSPIVSENLGQHTGSTAPLDKTKRAKSLYACGCQCQGSPQKCVGCVHTHCAVQSNIPLTLMYVCVC